MMIFIIGPRSVGKSVVGSALSGLLSCRFFDLDEAVLENLGAVGDENKFRHAELLKLELYLEDASGTHVISLGGGAGVSGYEEIDQRMRSILRSQGLVVCLLPYEDDRESLDVLQANEHIRGGWRTPALTKQLWSLRKEKYKSFSDIIVYTRERVPDAIAREISVKIAEKE